MSFSVLITASYFFKVAINVDMSIFKVACFEINHAQHIVFIILYFLLGSVINVDNARWCEFYVNKWSLYFKSIYTNEIHIMYSPFNWFSCCVSSIKNNETFFSFFRKNQLRTDRTFYFNIRFTDSVYSVIFVVVVIIVTQSLIRLAHGAHTQQEFSFLYTE